jgi:hypothetical protein
LLLQKQAERFHIFALNSFGNIVMEIAVGVVIIVLLLILRLNMPKIKGSVGEARAARKLSHLDPNEYKIINDVLITNGGRSSQIDHIVISRFGIFVIETKNYKGWIHGGEHSEYWTQSIYSDKFKFRNPIIQNDGHIRALKNTLREYPQAIYHSIVAFTGSAELKNVYSSTPVIYGSQLRWMIRKHSTTRCLSTEQVADIADKLSGMSKPDKTAKQNHIQQTRYQAYEREQAERLLVCPRCGAGLVERHGQYGGFYGCSNYPRCRYTLRR